MYTHTHTHIYQVYSTAMGVVGLAAPLIVPSIRQSMGYPTDNYYGLKSRCGELDYRYDTNVFSLENLFSRHSRFLCLARRRFETVSAAVPNPRTELHHHQVIMTLFMMNHFRLSPENGSRQSDRGEL